MLMRELVTMDNFFSFRVLLCTFSLLMKITFLTSLNTLCGMYTISKLDISEEVLNNICSRVRIVNYI